MKPNMTITTLLLLVAVMSAPSLSSAQTGTPSHSGVPTTSAIKLGLGFEPNYGQTSSQVNFVSRGPGYTAFLTTDGMVLSLHAQESASDALAAKGQPSSSMRANLRFRLLGAASNPAVLGEKQLAGRVNYFIGKDPKRWHRNIPVYAQVRYRNIYPGIDLLYHSNQGRMEYDFVVAPGADPRQLRFEIQGARHIGVDSNGSLRLETQIGELHFQAPAVFQESNGQRVQINGGYALEDATHIGFRIASYDASTKLVIDPVLLYSTYLGGSGSEQPAGIAVDASGNTYLTGSTDSTDFPLTTLGTVSAGSPHVFVMKVDPTGSNLVFADYFGGSGQDYGTSLALDAANNIYTTGGTSSSDFPLVSPYQGTQPGPYNAFLTKISADGSDILYSTYFGGNSTDLSVSVAVDHSGNMLIGGYTSSTNIPVANAYQSSVAPNLGGVYGYYGFLTKFNPEGSSLVYSTYFAGNSMVPYNCGGTPCWGAPNNTLQDMAVDSAGNAYVAGTTNTSNFPVTSGAYLTTDVAPTNSPIGFVGKFDGSGNLVYSTYFGDDVLTNISSIAVDGSGSAYITGLAITDGTFPLTSTGICDPSVYGGACNFAFVSKFDPTGATLVYSTFLGPNNVATPQAIALDANNNAYVLAGTASNTFSTVNGIENFAGETDILLVEIDATASNQLLATFLGGSGNDQPAPDGLALDSDGNIYIAGMTDSSDFPVTQSAFQTAFGGNTDALVAKLSPASAAAVSMSPLSLQFASQNVSSTSPAQSVILRNMGSAVLAISSISGNGDFSETDNCGTSVPAAGTCTLNITFDPTAPGARAGSIVIQDNAAGSPHMINLAGTGIGAAVSLAPATVTFPSQLIGSSSAAQVVTLSNTGNAPLSITSVQAEGDFGQTNNCPASLNAASACTINVTFTPTAAGTRTGTVTITDSASGIPQSVALSGIGVTPNASVSLSPLTLTFASQTIGSSSAARVVTLSNTGNEALSITSVQAQGDFAQTNNCPASLNTASACTINVTFTPTAAGTRTGNVTVVDSASGSSQSVALSGTGTSLNATVSLSPSTLTFSSLPVGSSGSPQVVTLSNTGNAALNITSVQVVGNFSQTNNCPASLSAGSGCSVNITFVPKSTGSLEGALSINDSAQSSPQVVGLSGTGSDFSLSASSDSDTITPGSTATYALKVSPVGGSFTNTVKLSCSGVPADATCSLSSSSVTPSGTVPVTVTIATAAASARAIPTNGLHHQPLAAFWTLPGFGLFGMMLVAPKRRLKEHAARIAIVLAICALLFTVGCAGGTGIAQQNQSGTTPGNYTITVTGTSGGLQHSVTMTLTVQ